MTTLDFIHVQDADFFSVFGFHIRTIWWHISAPYTCKINYVNMQEKLCQPNLIDMHAQDNYVYMQYNCVYMQENNFIVLTCKLQIFLHLR